ncbi:MAG: hypothetical protein GQ574_21450 [Crocinitomix sp.]|nr:hypothetical protein [Crocinitomix sp.]
MKIFRFTLLLILIIFSPIYGDGQESKIYRLSEYYIVDGPQFGFVSLTDGFPFSEHPDSLVIADEHLGNLDLEAVGDNAHTLNSIYRQRFLSRLGIKESDKLYIYHLVEDTIYTFEVSDLALVAYLTPYEPQLPIPDSDYYIGFEIKSKLLDMHELGNYRNDFVSIGKDCPFQVGHFKPMIWTKLETDNFPSFHRVKNFPSELDSFSVQDIYQSNMDGLTYYVMNYSRYRRNVIPYLLVADSLTNQLIYKKLFFQESDHDVISLRVERGDATSSDCQWAGKLFKNKATVFFNFIEPMFGCNSLYFVDDKQSFIEISCDNRH